jgi:hypothetical protein
MNSWVGTITLAVGLAAGTGAAFAAKPEPLPPDFSFTAPCPGDLTLTVEATGSMKVIGLPGERQIVSSPNLRVTVTAPNGNAVSYVVTGASHIEFLPNNITRTTATGRNLVFVPSSPGPAGIFLTVGDVSFTNNTTTGAEIERFSGTGRVVDVCQLLN